MTRPPLPPFATPRTPRLPARLATAATGALALGAAAVLILLGGCASPGTLPTPLAATAPAALGLADGPSAAGTFPAERWWQALGDPQLDALVDRALAEHPSLQQLQARVARASALVAAQDAAAQPQAGLSADLTRQRFTEHGIYPAPLAGSVRDLANVQLGGSIELDFFGRHAAAVRASVGQQKAALADAQAARVLLAANVARGYIGLARLFSLREVAERALAQRESLLALTRQRVDAGIDTALEQRSAEAGLPDARLQLAQLDEQIALARHQLAALSGQPPAALDTLRPALRPLQAAALPQHLGADLLGRRADVVAARWRVEASLADVAQARTQFYPDLNLVGFVGLNAVGVDRLFNLGSRQLGIGPALRLPIFDAGRLRAQLRGKAADADAAVAAYNGVLHDAVREVADAGTSLQALGRQQAESDAALASTEAAYDIARQRYQAGLSTQLQVLGAESAVLQQHRQAAELKARRLDLQVQLARALGGGWQPDAALALPAGGAAAPTAAAGIGASSRTATVADGASRATTATSATQATTATTATASRPAATTAARL